MDRTRRQARRVSPPTFRARAGVASRPRGRTWSAQGDRVDTIAAQHIGDPEQFWRVCDGNGVLQPSEVTEVVGRRVRIPLPEGMPGGPDHE